MLSVRAYSEKAIPHLQSLIPHNEATLKRIADDLFSDVKAGRSLFVFGSGHSSIFAMELYHRAGGVSFVIPLLADYLLPTAGPPVVRVFERTVGSANVLLRRAEPQAGEMLWLCSQSGINAAVVDLALEAKKIGMKTVAFTSKAHSQAVPSRHPSGKKLFEICDYTLDLMGSAGDACLDAAPDVKAGPLSSLGAILLGHSVLASVASRLEQGGHHCVYTSVNTPEGESRNVELERVASRRDPLLR